MGDTGKNNDLVIGLERAEELAEINDVSVDCIGGPIVAVYNARQIKRYQDYFEPCFDFYTSSDFLLIPQ